MTSSDANQSALRVKEAKEYIVQNFITQYFLFFPIRLLINKSLIIYKIRKFYSGNLMFNLTFFNE